MQSDYLPKYFQDNNAGKHQDTDPMTSDYRSFYAFRIGEHYIVCLLLRYPITNNILSNITHSNLLATPHYFVEIN